MAEGAGCVACPPATVCDSEGTTVPVAVPGFRWNDVNESAQICAPITRCGLGGSCGEAYVDDGNCTECAGGFFLVTVTTLRPYCKQCPDLMPVYVGGIAPIAGRGVCERCVFVCACVCVCVCVFWRCNDWVLCCDLWGFCCDVGCCQR